MARVFTLMDDGGGMLCTVSAADDSMMLTNVMRKRADSLSGSTPAQVTIGSGNGAVTYTSRYGGTFSNGCRITHSEGYTGPGHESRPLGLSTIDLEVVVTFGTDSGGNSLVPTAQQVADLVNADPDASEVMIAVAGGTGLNQVPVAAITPFEGGLDDGDCLKFLGSPPTCRRINRVEVI